MRTRAFTLVEVVISMVLVLFTLLVAFNMFTIQKRAVAHSDMRYQATTLAYSILEQWRAGTITTAATNVAIPVTIENARYAQGMTYDIRVVTPAPAPAPPGNTLQDVAVTVRFTDATGPKSITVETLVRP